MRRSYTAPRRALEWDLPGGLIEKDEDPMNAAIRELYEECGVRLEILKEAYVQVDDLDNRTIVRHYYQGISDSAEVQLSYEHDMFKWISPNDFLLDVVYKPHIVAFNTIFKKGLETSNI